MNEIDQKKLAKFNRLIDENANFIKNNDWCLKNFEKIKADDSYLKSLSVSVTVLMEYYPVTRDKAISCLTEGGRDYCIDLFYYDDAEIYEENGQKYINIVVIQSKYRKDSTNSKSALSETDINNTISNVNHIINGNDLPNCNSLLSKSIKNFRKLIEDNDYPSVRCFVYFSTNGRIEESFLNLECVKNTSNDISCNFISNTNFGKDTIVPMTTQLKILGEKQFEKSTNGINSCVVETTLKNLVDFYNDNGKDALLASNVRYLLTKSNINKKIQETAIDTPDLFWFYNNGISIVSKAEIKENKTGTKVHFIQLGEPNIINGGQTTVSISQLYSMGKITEAQLEKATVLVRIYNTDDDSIIYKIAQATNSQNPIDIIDLRANNIIQKYVVDYFSKKGVALIVKAGQDLTDYINGQITNEGLLQMYATVYGGEPAKARTSKRSIFNKYFDLVFNSDEYEHNMSEKLYRCFELEQFLIKKKQNNPDELLISYAWYSIVYCMNLIDEGISNIDKTSNNWDKIFDKSLKYIKEIVQKRNDELKEAFSLNNLFKSTDIQALIKNKIKDNKKNEQSNTVNKT